MFRKPSITLAVVLLSGTALAAKELTPAAPAPVEDFTFMQFSDIHVSPQLARDGVAKSVRGQSTIDWLCAEAGKPQRMSCFDLTAPPPAFALATGDLTEYGVIDDTWESYEKAFAKLPCPMYVLPGNHDNTWVAMYDVMRRRHGGENYSFDHGGCHFVCISSASPQEPVPSIDARTRTWLAADLAATKPGTPVFLALHHPPDSGEFASPAEFDTLVDMLRDHNVALILYGHGHSAVHREFAGIDGIMGGSTFGKRSGYAVINTHAGRLRAAYFFDPVASERKGSNGQPHVKALIDKPLAMSAPKRLFEIVEPRADQHASGATLPVTVRFADDATAQKIEARIDGKPVATARLDGERSADAPSDQLEFVVPLDDLAPGAHLLTVEASSGKRMDLRTRTIQVDRPAVEVPWRQSLPAAVKAAPVVAGDLVIVADNDGALTALDRRSGAAGWRFSAGAEILGSPALDDDTLVFGAGDGKVYGVSRTGQRRWARDVGLPVYGGVLVCDGVAYVGDNSGRLHALGVADGEPRWTVARADYGIEGRPVRWRDLLVFGAWDGYVYAVDAATGKLRWKTLGPKSSEGKGIRYYGPADCGPIVVDDRLWICDRGYELGQYDAEGKLLSKQAAKVSGITAAADGKSFFARTTDDRVLRLDADGKTLWEQKLPAGRFPIPPTAHEGRLYVCSNTGLLSVLDAKTGKPLGEYQATPGFYVMAPVTVHPADGPDKLPVCYVAGMDGTVAAVRFK